MGTPPSIHRAGRLGPEERCPGGADSAWGSAQRRAFTGSSGIIVRLSTNHFRLTSRPQWALYQYHVDYNPLMEARRLRSALLFQHEDLIGRCHAFDGTILFLPKRLQHKVTFGVALGGGGGVSASEQKCPCLAGEALGETPGAPVRQALRRPQSVCRCHRCAALVPT